METTTNVPATQAPQSNVPVVTKSTPVTGNLDSSDIQIPRLHLLQGMSEGVAEGTYKLGDIIHTSDQVVVGGKDKPVVFIPFHVMKVNQKFRTDVSPKEYIKTEPAGDHPWEQKYVWEKPDGEQVTCKVNNYRTVIVHGILPGDEDDMALPVSITFKSSAGKNSKSLVSHFATVQQFNTLKGTDTRPYNFAWHLSSEHVKGDGQSYARWTMKKARKCTSEEIEECDSWALALNHNTQAYAEHSATTEAALSENSQPTVKTAAPQDLDDIPF